MITTIVSQDGWASQKTKKEQSDFLHAYSPLVGVSHAFYGYELFHVISEKVYGKKGKFKIVWTNGHEEWMKSQKNEK